MSMKSLEKYDLLWKNIVYIWRFQPFHLWHLDAILQWIESWVNHIYIVIWSAQESWTTKNPWACIEREKFIRMSLLSAKISDDIYTIYALDDLKWDDESRFIHLQKSVPHFDILMSGNPWLHEICETQDIFYYNPFSDKNRRVDISATQIREWIIHENWEEVHRFINYSLL